MKVGAGEAVISVIVVNLQLRMRFHIFNQQLSLVSDAVALRSISVFTGQAAIERCLPDVFRCFFYDLPLLNNLFTAFLQGPV